MAAGRNPLQYLQQHIIPSSLPFLGNEYNADHSRGYNVEVDSGYGITPSPFLPQAFLGNPSPTLAIWFLLSGTK